MSNQIASSRFKILDGIVKRCLIEAGSALEEIRDKELFKSAGHKTFKDYCESLGKNYHWAWRQISGASVAKTFTNANVPNEATAREIKKIALPQRRQVVSEAAKENKGKLSASAVKNANQRPLQSKSDAPKDGTGLPIPPEIQQFWNRNEEAQYLLSLVSKIKTTLEKAKEDNDPLFRFVDLQGSISRLMMVYEEIECAKSFAVCWKCNGVTFKDCPECKGRGSFSKFNWGYVPEEIRKLRE